MLAFLWQQFYTSSLVLWCVGAVRQGMAGRVMPAVRLAAVYTSFGVVRSGLTENGRAELLPGTASGSCVFQGWLTAVCLCALRLSTGRLAGRLLAVFGHCALALLSVTSFLSSAW